MRATTPDGEPRNRFVYLLLALSGLILLEIVVPSRTAADILQSAAFFAVMVLTARALSRRRWVLWTTTFLGVFGVVGNVITIFSHAPTIEVLGLASIAIFMTFTAIMILGEVFRVHEVTQDQIFGAICAYVLIGIAWAALYSTIYVLDPGAFSLPAPST